MTSNARDPRSVQTRETEVRKKSWQEPSLLPDPEPKAGWVYRWIRTSIYGAADPANISRQFREGWEPVKYEDHPELRFARDASGKFKDGIEIGGLLLCRIPEEIINQRKAHYDKVARDQIRAVDNNFMRENDPRMPLLRPERRTDVQFGGGSKPSVDEV
jgi:hypothetical protein